MLSGTILVYKLEAIVCLHGERGETPAGLIWIKEKEGEIELARRGKDDIIHFDNSER